MTASSPAKINIVSFEEWTSAILTVTKTDALLQGMYDCNYSGEISRLRLKKSNA